MTLYLLVFTKNKKTRFPFWFKYISLKERIRQMYCENFVHYVYMKYVS